jgi:hypothetical protein
MASASATSGLALTTRFERTRPPLFTPSADISSVKDDRPLRPAVMVGPRTKVPEPWFRLTRPSLTRIDTAWRTVILLTP